MMPTKPSLRPAGRTTKRFAKRLHDDIMSVGNSLDPAEAYRQFRGRDPQIDGLLRARGFTLTGQAE